MPRYTKAEQERRKQSSLRTLSLLLPFGASVHPVLTHVSRSGMSRRFKVLIIPQAGERYISNISLQVADVLDLKWIDGEVMINGCGMDMGYHIVYQLASALGYKDAERETNCYGLNHKSI